MKKVFIGFLIVLLLVPLPVVDVGYAGHNIKGDFQYENNGDGTATLTNYHGSSKDVVIPSEIDGLTVTDIRKDSPLHGAGFDRKNLTSVKIPDTVTTIGDSVFSHNNLTSIDIPNSVEKIGARAFSGNNIEELLLHNSVRELKGSAFADNNIKKLSLPNNLEFIEDKVFYNNEITSVDLPKGLKVIGVGAFENNKLTDIFIPNSIKSIESMAFQGNNLSKVIIDSKDVEMETMFGVTGIIFMSNPKDMIIYGYEPSTVKDYAELVQHNFENIEGGVDFSRNGNNAYEKTHTTKVDVEGHDKSKALQYAWSTSTSTPSSGWTNITSGSIVKRTSGTGSYYLHVRGTNLLGDAFNARTNVFKLDNTVPTLSVTQSPTGDTDGNVTITVKGSDSHSGVKRIREEGGSWTNGSSMTKSVSSNGTYKFEVEDNAGNKATKSIAISNIDKTKPSVSLSKNGGDYATSHSTKITATDSDSGISKVEYRWTTSSSFPSSGFTGTSSGSTVSSPSSTGNHYLHVKATDKAGNVREFSSSAFKIDRTKPSNPSISVPSGWQKESVSISIKEGSDSHSGVDRTEYRTNSGSWNTYIDSFSVSSNGETAVQARTVDNVGNVSDTVQVTVKVDKEKPTLTITPSTTSETHENVTITVKGSDSHSGVKRIREEGGSWTKGSSMTKSVSSNGTYKFEVEDNAGNKATKSITISNIDKSISFAKPTVGLFDDVTLGEQTKVTSTNINSLAVKDWRDGNNEWKMNVSATPLKNGTHMLPKGSMRMMSISSVKKVEGSGSLPTKGFNSTTIIDDGIVKLLESDDARGEYEVNFPSNALEIHVDPTTAKTGTYESTITWELVNAP